MWGGKQQCGGTTRKETAWKGVLAASDEENKERCMEAYRGEKRRVKRCIIQSKKSK